MREDSIEELKVLIDFYEKHLPGDHIYKERIEKLLKGLYRKLEEKLKEKQNETTD